MSASTQKDIAEYRRLGKIISITDGALFLAILALTIYWLVTISGPVRWLGELQLLIFKDWASAKLAAVLTFLFVLFPAYMVLEKLQAPLIRRKDELKARILAAGGQPDLPEPTRADMRGKASGLTKWSLVALVTGLVLSIGSILAYQHFKRSTDSGVAPGEVQRIDVRSDDKPLLGKFASVMGIAIPSAAHAWDDAASKARFRATPLVARAWPPQTEVQYFVLEREGTNARIGNDMHSLVVDGEIVVNGLPPIVKAAFSEKRIRITEPYYVIRPHDDRDTSNPASPVTIAIGLVGVLLVIGSLPVLLGGLLMKRRYR